jgi:LysM repeat protein
LSGDLEARTDGTWTARIGGELLLYRGLMRLRAGNGYSVAGTQLIALGAGFNFAPIQFDVTYLAPIRGIDDNAGQMRIGLTYRFEAPRFSEVYFDRALGRSEMLDRKIMDLEDREARLQAAVDDLDQARRIAEEELARVRVREREASQSANERLLVAERKAQEAEIQFKEVQDQLESAEAKLSKLREEVGKLERIKSPPPPPRPRPAPPPKPTIRTHEVAAGETLRGLALKYYGSAEQWRKIFEANPDKIERGRPRVGVTLVIPD